MSNGLEYFFKEEFDLDTKDNWQPNFVGNKVHAKVAGYHMKSGVSNYTACYTATIKGAGELILEKRYCINVSPESIPKAIKKFTPECQKLVELIKKLPQPITIQVLKEQGFVEIAK